jgi:hypothetical protein
MSDTISKPEPPFVDPEGASHREHVKGPELEGPGRDANKVSAGCVKDSDAED